MINKRKNLRYLPQADKCCPQNLALDGEIDFDEIRQAFEDYYSGTIDLFNRAMGSQKTNSPAANKILNTLSNLSRNKIEIETEGNNINFYLENHVVIELRDYLEMYGSLQNVLSLLPGISDDGLWFPLMPLISAFTFESTKNGRIYFICIPKTVLFGEEMAL